MKVNVQCIGLAVSVTMTAFGGEESPAGLTVRPSKLNLDQLKQRLSQLTLLPSFSPPGADEWYGRALISLNEQNNILVEACTKIKRESQQFQQGYHQLKLCYYSLVKNSRELEEDMEDLQQQNDQLKRRNDELAFSSCSADSQIYLLEQDMIKLTQKYKRLAKHKQKLVAKLNRRQRRKRNKDRRKG